MSVWITITTGAGTYRFASISAEHGGDQFVGRLLNAPQIEGRQKAGDGGNPVRQVQLSIDNSEGRLPIATDPLWGGVVEIETDGVTEVWTGEVKEFSQDGRGVLSITAAENVLAAFKLLLPDEVVRIGDYSDATREAVNTTVPMVLGGTAADPVRVRAICVDRVNFRYLVCVGEIQSVVAVLKDRVAITTGFTSYKGTAAQAVYPGFAYLEFAADPRDDAGRWPEILVDVTGLKLGASSEAECRNPARQLQYLLTTARGGACGWGLGIDSGDLDAASFAQAITDCDTAGFVADGIIATQRAASFWVSQLCQTMRGELTFEAGKWTLRIDQIRASAASFTTANMRLDRWGRGVASERINRTVIDYRYDATDGTLLGSAQRNDTTSQTAIGINERRLQLLLARDHTSANLIADYLANLETYGEQRIRFYTDSAVGALRQGDTITITRADLGLSGALFRVTSIVPRDFESLIEARGYSDSIFGTTAPSSATDPATDPVLPGSNAATVAPAVASGLNLTTGVVVQPDGTVVAYIDATWTNGARTLYADVEIGEGASPAAWRAVCSTQAESTHIDALKVGQLYTVRVTSRNTGGSSAAVTASTTTAADTTPPGTPGNPLATVYFKNIRLRAFQNATKANDMSHFEVYRHTSNDSASATKIGTVACGPKDDGVVFLDEGTAYGATYYYWTKSVDRSGNASGFSAVVGPLTTLQAAGADIVAGSITTNHIAAAGISADCITTGVLDAICICGVCLYACTGTVGGWKMDAGCLYAKADSGGIVKEIALYCPGAGWSAGGYMFAYTYLCCACQYGATVTIGGAQYVGSWLCDTYGISITDGGVPMFQAWVTEGRTACCFKIAGWDFTTSTFSAGTGTCGVGMHAGTSCPAFWAGCDVGGSAPFRVSRLGAALATNLICACACAACRAISVCAYCILGQGYGCCAALFEAACCLAVTAIAPVYAISATGTNYAVYACTSGSSAILACSGSNVVACMITNCCMGVSVSAACIGVFSYVSGYYAVFGCACTAYGVIGSSAGCVGTYGYAASCHGVLGIAASCFGVYGCAYTCYAVAGNTDYFCSSSRFQKIGRRNVSVLDRVLGLCIQRWMYHDRNARGFAESIGPMAEDVAEAFGLGHDNHMIGSMDGIALRAIQEIYACMQRQQECIMSMADRLAKFDSERLAAA